MYAHLDRRLVRRPECPPATWIERGSFGASVSAPVGDAARNVAAPDARSYETSAETETLAAIGVRVRIAAPWSLWPTRRRRPARPRSPAMPCTHMTGDWASVWPATTDL